MQMHVREVPLAELCVCVRASTGFQAHMHMHGHAFQTQTKAHLLYICIHSFRAVILSCSLTTPSPS